jgi:hypothetical protein
MLPGVAEVPRELRTIVKNGFEPVLLPAGFKREGSFRWRRATPELEHVIQMLRRRGMCDVQWGIVSPEVTSLVWGERYGDVGDAAMTGFPSGIRHPAQAQSFRLDDGRDADDIAAGVAEDMRVVEAWMRPFQTRAQLREYLMLNRDRTDRRGFLVPANLPLKVYTAAALAVVDRSPDASALISEAATELESFNDDLNRGRMNRLREAAQGLAST